MRLKKGFHSTVLDTQHILCITETLKVSCAVECSDHEGSDLTLALQCPASLTERAGFFFHSGNSVCIYSCFINCTVKWGAAGKERWFLAVVSAGTLTEAVKCFRKHCMVHNWTVDCCWPATSRSLRLQPYLLCRFLERLPEHLMGLSLRTLSCCGLGSSQRSIGAWNPAITSFPAKL